MPFKYCPSCRHISYCAAAGIIWICPCCGQDISAHQATADPRRAAAGARPTASPRPAEPGGPRLFVLGSRRK